MSTLWRVWLSLQIRTKNKKERWRAPHDDQFLSCYEWGNTFGIHETHFESKIKDSVQTTDNSFENESIFLSTDSRATQRRKGKKRKSRFSYKQEHDDPEIEKETKIYNGYITSYIRYLDGWCLNSQKISRLDFLKFAGSAGTAVMLLPFVPIGKALGAVVPATGNL